MEFKEISKEEFAKFRKNISGGGFYQRAERAQVRSRMGWTIYFLAACEDEKILAAGLVMVKKGAALLQMGPLMKKNDAKVLRFFIESLRDFAKEKKCTTLEIYPSLLLSKRAIDGTTIEAFDQNETMKTFEELGFKYKGRTVEVDPKVIRWMTVKDLSEFKDLAAVQASYKKNVRNKLRKITPLLKIHALKEKSELGEWIRPLNDSNRKNGVEGWGRGVDYYEDIWDAFGDQVSFMEVRTKEGDELVSSRMVFNFDDETETFSSGTIQALRQFNGMTFMQDWQIDQCLKAGQKRINFYGIAGDFSKDNHLLEFKSGFGVIVEEYIGGFEIVLNPLKHNAERAAHLVRRAGGIAKRGIGKIVKRAKTRQTKVVHKVSTE
jgi:lipid II:glycine glycyltransferase (peptidoglycan interpeptide bridge formation enzyme)